MPPTKLTPEQQADLCVDALKKAKVDARLAGKEMPWAEVHATLVPFMAGYAPTNDENPTPEEVYAAYPRKIGRKAAVMAISRAVKRGVTLQQLLKAVKAYAVAIANWPKEDRQYVPYPSTWFNRDSHLDDPSEWTRDQLSEPAPKDYARL